MPDGPVSAVAWSTAAAIMGSRRLLPRRRRRAGKPEVWSGGVTPTFLMSGTAGVLAEEAS